MFCKADAGRYNTMTAEIVECSEVDADLVMLCRTQVPVNVLLMLIASRVG